MSKSSDDRSSMRFKCAVVAVDEDERDRVVFSGRFGDAGAMWMTTVGVTLANELEIVRGTGWSPGTGAWRVPRGRHPVPIGLDLSIRVASQALEPVTPLEEPTQPILYLREYDFALVKEYVERRVEALGVADVKTLVAQLREFLSVWDPDD